MTRLPQGCQPLSRAERKRIAKEQQRSEWPSVLVWRLLKSCEELEAQIGALRAQHTEEKT